MAFSPPGAYTESMYLASAALIGAAADYRWLLDSGYPEQASIKLVGDRFALGKEERLVLFRGISSSAASASRRSAQVGGAAGRLLLVDAYNQIYSVMHYLAGKPVFVCSDGLLRDAGAAHGRISNAELFDRAAATLARGLARAHIAKALAYFDSPVPYSAAHARAFRETLSAAGVDADCPVVKSADFPLKEAPPGSAAATSDSGIVDDLAKRAPPIPIFDAARFAIEKAFGPRPWLDMGEILSRKN
jgi:hypothetical protein